MTNLPCPTSYIFSQCLATMWDQYYLHIMSLSVYFPLHMAVHIIRVSNGKLVLCLSVFRMEQSPGPLISTYSGPSNTHLFSGTFVGHMLNPLINMNNLGHPSTGLVATIVFYLQMDVLKVWKQYFVNGNAMFSSVIQNHLTISCLY